MNSFLYDVISKLIKAEFQGHTSFKVADNKAVGDNPVRELHLDAVPVNDDQSIVSLAWDGGNKLFEKTLPSEEAKHNFELISSDMSEAVSLTSNGKIDEAKKLMESLVNKYSEQSGEMVTTNLPPVTTTQASKDEFAGLWKQAKVSLRNIFPSGTIQDLTFDSQEELSSYQDKMKELSPQDHIPLWDQQGQKGTEEESPEMAPPSMSYSDIEKEKEKEHKNLEKSIDEKIKTEVESALIEKAATVFGPDQVELVEVLRKNGRNWDEIKKILVKDFNFDKEATTIFVDDLRSKEEGPDSNLPEAPKPPENLVSPETHDKLLEDLDKSVDEKKSEPPVKEEKEPTFTPKDIMDIPEEKESSKKCPKCGEDVWDVSTVDQRLNKCWNCGTRFDNPEAEASLSNEIARADNAEIRKVAAAINEDLGNGLKLVYLPANQAYMLMWNDSRVAGPAPYEELKQKANELLKKSSLNKKALNPLQEPPIVEQPTAETSNQDIVPISQTPDHDTPAKGDRVFVMSDLGEEKAGFEGTYVSEYTSKGNQYAIIETDEKDLLDVEMHRVSKVSENTSPEPAIEPNVQKPEEPDIEVTPKMEDLHSSLKTEAAHLSRIPYSELKHCDNCNGLAKEPETDDCSCHDKGAKNDSTNDKISSLEDIKVEVKKLEAQLKTAEEEKDVCSQCGKEVGLIEMSKWIKDGLCSECRGTEKKADNVMDTKCEDCGKPLGPEVFLSKWPVCGECTRKKHKKVTGTEKVADPVPANPTQLKDVKITPDYVQKEKAVPANVEQSEVISKMQAIESNLSTLDRAKEEVKAKLTAELKRIDDAGERAYLEAEYKNQIEKLSILIDAVDSKLIKYNDMFYAFQQGEVKVVPKLTPKELLEKIYRRFSEAEKFVQDVTNGMLSLAKSVTTRTLTRWPEKRSELGKEASVSDELAQMNQQMLEALNLLSVPIE